MSDYEARRAALEREMDQLRWDAKRLSERAKRVRREATILQRVVMIVGFSFVLLEVFVLIMLIWSQS